METKTGIYNESKHTVKEKWTANKPDYRHTEYPLPEEYKGQFKEGEELTITAFIEGEPDKLIWRRCADGLFRITDNGIGGLTEKELLTGEGFNCEIKIHEVLPVITPKEQVKVIDSSYGGWTGINDYHLSDGTTVTCRPSELNQHLTPKEQPKPKNIEDLTDEQKANISSWMHNQPDQ